MLEFKKDAIFYSGNPVDVNKIDFEEFLMANLSQPVRIDPILTLEEIIHSLFKGKKFINAYFSEEYSAINAMISIGKMPSPIKEIRIYKTIEYDNEDNMIYITPHFQLIEPKDGDESTLKVARLTINIDLEIEDVDDVLNIETVKKPKSEFLLMDLLTIIFDDLAHAMKQKNMLI